MTVDENKFNPGDLCGTGERPVAIILETYVDLKYERGRTYRAKAFRFLTGTVIDISQSLWEKI